MRNSRFIGETSRHFATRVKEHLSTDKNSHVYKHVNGLPNCKRKCSVGCFKIVDSANSRHCLKLKEAIYISRSKGTSTLTKGSLQITRNNFKNQICLKF